jgi:multidrug efflux pump subunit AcrB
VTAQLQRKLPALSASAICAVTNQNISGDDSQLKIDLSGADSTVLDNTARLVRSKLQLVPGLSIEGAADDKGVLPRYQITLNYDLLQKMEIKPDDVLSRIREYLSQGTRINVMTGDQQSTAILLQTDLLNSTANTINGSSAAGTDPETAILMSLGKETFTGKDGQMIRMNQIASISRNNGPSVIREREGRPFSVVTANITSRDVEKVTRQTQNVLDQLQLPNGVKYSFNGTSAQVNQMIFEMAIALSVSILLVLVIVSIVFRGWRAPLSVLLCIPLAFIGSVLGMLVFGKEWNLAAFVGLLMLSGIVVTNGIVLVDKIERNLAGGMNSKEAILHGTASRVRPVLMTAVTTILTLLPLSFSGSGDTIISQTLGIVVVCGMISSTMISLLLIPVIYELLLEKKAAHSFLLVPKRR